MTSDSPKGPMQDLNPATNPDAQAALSRRYGNSTVMVLPLDSGRFAIFGRDGQIHTILDDAPSADELRTLSSALAQKLASRTAEARFYGEPDDKVLTRDFRQAAKPARPAKPVAIALEIDL